MTETACTINVLKRIRQRFPRGGFARNVIVMMTGTTLAQALSIAIAPILTRLYTPSDYGVFALYASLCSMIIVISTGRYEAALMLPESDDDAINLAALATIINITVSLVTLVVVTIINQSIARVLGNIDIAPWLYLVPLTVFLTGSYQTLYYWSNRRRQFKRLSVGKVCGSLTGSSMNLGLGFAGIGVCGLILGGLAGQATTSSILCWQLWGEDRKKVAFVSRPQIKMLAKRYYGFPLFSLPSDLVNVAAQQVPVFLFNGFFGLSVVGYFSLTQRVLGMPLSLISISIRDVFRERASSDYIKLGNCRDIYIKTLKSLTLISVLPFLTFCFTAPFLFSWIFGQKWQIAGEYAQILAPLFWIRFIVSPLSYVLYVAEKQDLNLIGQLLLLISTVVSIIIGGIHNNAKLSIILFSTSYFVVYLYYLGVSYIYSNKENRR